MIALVLDTHAAVWLMVGSPRLSKVARQATENALQSGAKLAVPTVSLVEVAYLEEKGSLSKGTLAPLFALLDDTGSGLVVIPLTRQTVIAFSAFRGRLFQICLTASSLRLLWILMYHWSPLILESKQLTSTLSGNL